MAELKGSKTEQNLSYAFAGESQARNKYTFFASVARKEGYEQIAAIFEETAGNEKEHAKLHAKALGMIGNTAECLRDAIGGEDEETRNMYPTMAGEARAEGFAEIAAVFDGLARIEASHRDRYKALLANLQQGTVFKKAQKIRWRCRNCGNIHEGADAPKVCPVCKHPQAYYEVIAENY